MDVNAFDINNYFTLKKVGSPMYFYSKYKVKGGFMEKEDGTK